MTAGLVAAVLLLAGSAAGAGAGPPAAGPDVWLRPGHLRAVAQPPTQASDLQRVRRRVRLWWDQACQDASVGPPGDPLSWRAWSGAVCATAEIEQLRGKTWVMVADGALPGWVSKPVAAGAAFRVRLSGGDWTGRTSQPVTAPWLYSPTDLARLGSPPGSLLGARVGQISAQLQTGTVWVSTLGGGAARLSSGGLVVQPLTRWEGLPDDRAVAVDHCGAWALVGTGGGAALVGPQGVAAIIDQALPSPWTQAALISPCAPTAAPAAAPAVLWVGTDQGLSRVTSDSSQTVLSPWSVFSLAAAAQGGVWVGYNGLTRLDAEGGMLPPAHTPQPGAQPSAQDRRGIARPPAPQPLTRLPGEHLYDIQETADRVLVASQETGLRVLRLAPLASAPAPTHALQAYGVAFTRSGTWLARGPLGLQAPSGTRMTRAQGLPSDSVWSVADAGAGVWAGTAAGVARVLPAAAVGGAARVASLPLSAWPADSASTTLLGRRRGWWLAGAGGLTQFGRPHRRASALTIGARQPVISLLDDEQGGVWAIGTDAVHLDRRGRLSLMTLPGPARAATMHQGALWVATSAGLWRTSPSGVSLSAASLSAGSLSAGSLSAVSSLSGVRRLASGPQALWAIAQRRVTRLLAGSPRPFLQTHPALDLSPDPTVVGEIWVGTENGLERLITRGEHEGDVVDVLGAADQGVVVPAVAADGRGGCWMAASDGTVAHVGRDGQRAWLRLVETDPPWPVAVVLDPDARGQAAWVLTEHGTWKVLLELPD